MLRAVVLLAFFGCLTLTGCVYEDDIDTASPTEQLLRDILPQGEWRVFTFTSDGNNLTALLDGYTLIFTAEGSLVAVGSASVAGGIWAVGGTQDRPILVLNFSGSTPLENINRTWDIDSYSTTLIRLNALEDEGATFHELVLERI